MESQFVICEVGTENTVCILSAPWASLLDVVLSLRRPGFEPEPFKFGLLGDKVALRQVFLRALCFPSYLFYSAPH
jgi:hypothetical protein